MGKPKKKRTPSAYNRHIGREMKAGKTMKQAAASWKGKSSRKSRPKKRSNKSTTRRSNRVGRKGGFNTQKIFKLLRLAALVAPGAIIAAGGGSMKDKAQWIATKYTGVRSDGSFSFQDLAAGWTPYLASIAVTYGIPKIAGLIRGL